MESKAKHVPGLEYVVEKLADCTELLATVEAAPNTPERERVRDELKTVQRRLLSAACAFGPAERTWLAE
jgi:cob(I)alamin adenosyltransferase